MKVCPNNPDHKEFITTGVEYHDWLVDEHGNFLDDKGCYEARIHNNGYAECVICHAVAQEVPA